MERQKYKTDTMDVMRKDYKSMYDFFLNSKSLLKAWFEICVPHTFYCFLQALIYFVLYYFFFGYFTNIFLFCYKETDRPKYMARLYCFYGYNKKVL